MKLYRYDIEYETFDNYTRVNLKEYEVISETDKTYLIETNLGEKRGF